MFQRENVEFHIFTFLNDLWPVFGEWVTEVKKKQGDLVECLFGSPSERRWWNVISEAELTSFARLDGGNIREMEETYNNIKALG